MSGTAVALLNHGLWLVLALSGPPILAAMVTGLLVSIVQAATQLQEQTTQYALKLLAVALCLAIFGRLLGSSIYAYADQIFSNFQDMVRR